MSYRPHALLFAAIILALSAIGPPAEASRDVTPARVAGPDRIDTAAAVAELAHPDGASTALLARADHWPDALAGVPLAGVLDAPIFLTNTSDVPVATSQVLQRLGVDNVVLLGGPGAITPRVEQELAQSYTVERIAGLTHYGTAAAVARAVAARGDIGATPGGKRSAFLASGATFPDALAAGAPAALGPNRMPILLTAPNALPQETTAALDDLPIEQVLIVGGTVAISDAVSQQLEERGLNVVRLAGATRTQTAAAIADFAVDILPATPEVVHIARSDAFPDALSAGPLAASVGGPLLLTQDTNQLGGAAGQWLAARCPDVRVVRAVGGSLAVTTAVLNEAERAAQSCHPIDGHFRTCIAETDGYRVEYPGSWHTNDPATTEPCRFFHPEPFQATPATEATDVAVVIRFTSAPYDSIVESTVESPAGAVILTDERLSVAGSRAARVTTRATGEGLLAEGTRSVQWFVDFDTRTMTAMTLSLVEGFEANAQVLDQMMRGLVRVEPPGRAPTCSASGMAADVADQPELPAPVRDMRRRIAEAAVACDFERLAALAGGGSRPFTYSFGGGGEPADYWRRQEEGPGPHPLRYLVGVLDRPHQRLEPHHDLSARYVWPSAFGYDSWEAVPRDAKEALKPLYTEEDFENFLRFGGYTGYRVGIAPDGEWLFFVAGD